MRNDFSHGFVRYEEPVKIIYKNDNFIGNVTALNNFINMSGKIVSVFQEKLKDAAEFYEKINKKLT